MRTVALLLACCVGSLTAAPVPKVKPATVTYKFKATIRKDDGRKANGPFKEGAEITGQFTYDINGELRREDKEVLKRDGKDYNYHAGHFYSKHNAISFEYGGLKFESAGEVGMGLSSCELGCYCAVLAKEGKLPEGWAVTGKGSSGFCGVTFTSRTPELINPKKPPAKLKLDDFENAFILNFSGLSYPKGGGKQNVSVTADIETLEEVK